MSIEEFNDPKKARKIALESIGLANLIKSRTDKVDITEDFIRIRQREPSEFEKDSFRTITISVREGIKAVIGRLKGKTTTTIQTYLFDKDKWTVGEAKKWVRRHEANAKLEMSPYKTIDELPENVKSVLPVGAQLIWLRTFNTVLEETNDEDKARQSAWRNVKLKYEKVPDKKKWVRKK